MPYYRLKLYLVLLLLDLSAAADIDHGILSDWLESQCSISGLALAWLKTYLLERTQCVSYSSVFTDVRYVVPQGSVLGTLLLSLYISPLGQIIQRYGKHFYCYSNHTQLDERENNKIRDLHVVWWRNRCQKTSCYWMLVIGTTWQRHYFDQAMLTLDNCVTSQSPTVKNFGEDSTLSVNQHIEKITDTASYHLCNIAEIRPFLSTADAKILIHVFVSSRLDFFNALFLGLSRDST